MKQALKLSDDWKPCPLCNQPPRVSDREEPASRYEHDRFQVTVQCLSGHHTICVSVFGYTLKDATARASKEWNTRPMTFEEAVAQIPEGWYVDGLRRYYHKEKKVHLWMTGLRHNDPFYAYYQPKEGSASVGEAILSAIDVVNKVLAKTHYPFPEKQGETDPRQGSANDS